MLQTPQTPPKGSHKFKITQYSDEHGRSIREAVPVGNKPPPEGHVRFCGAVQVGISLPETQQPVNTRLDFAIPGAHTLQEAFDQFDACIEPAIEAWIHRQRQMAATPRILRPGGPLN